MVEPRAIPIGGFVAGAGPSLLSVYGLGSCVALVLFDPEAEVGGLAHILLPGPRLVGDDMADLPAKYADEAVTVLSKAVASQGGRSKRLVAGVVGGARIFSSESALDGGVGARNIQGALEALSLEKIPVRWQEVGGESGRTVRFELPSGKLLVRTLREEWREIPPLR